MPSAVGTAEADAVQECDDSPPRPVDWLELELSVGITGRPPPATWLDVGVRVIDAAGQASDAWIETTRTPG